jgi:hypothetical protein
MARSKKSFYGWRSRRSEKHAAESSSIELGGWKRQKISASFFRCWQFLGRLKRANYEEALDLYGRNDV